MIAVVLAAGISSRLRPLTDSLPKTLLPVAGTPLLQRLLRALAQAEIERVIIVSGYRHQMIEQFVRSLDLRQPVSFIVNASFETTGNNYSLSLAGPIVSGHPMLLLDSDILFDPAALTLLLRSPHTDALLVRSATALGHEEIKVVLDGRGRVVRIGREIDPADASGESIGIEKFSARTTASLFEVLAERKTTNELYEVSFQKVIDGGASMYAVDCGSRPCMEIDTPEDLHRAEDLARAYGI